MLERELLRIVARSTRSHRILAHRLQRTTPSSIARPTNAECVRCNPTRFAHRSPLMNVALDGATSHPHRGGPQGDEDGSRTLSARHGVTGTGRGGNLPAAHPWPGAI